MKKLIYILLVLVFVSCNLIRMVQVGTQEQDDEGFEEVKSFLNKKNYLYDKSFMLTDVDINKKMKSKKHTLGNPKKGYSYIQVRVYDSIGNYYSAYSQCLGSFNEKHFLTSYPAPLNDKFNFLNTSLKFSSELELISTTKEEKENVLNISRKHPYTIVVYWNIRTKYYSKKVLKEVSNYKKKYKDKIYVILCNSAKSKSP